MTKQQAQQRKTEIESELKTLQEIIDAPEVTKEQRFWGLLNGLQVKIDFKKYPTSLFLFSGDECWVEFDMKNGYIWLRYSTIWGVLEKEYDMQYGDTSTFIKSQVEEHFKMKGIRPFRLFKQAGSMVEEHFKMKGVTPQKIRSLYPSWVEEHFKNKGVTPNKSKTKYIQW